MIIRARIMGAVVALMVYLGGSAMADFPAAGEWPCFRANSRLDGRATCKGHITTPKIAWKHYIGAIRSLVSVAPGVGSGSVRVPAPKLDGPATEIDSPRWGMRSPLADIGGKQQPLDRSITTTYGDIFSEIPGLEKIEFESAFHKPSINGQWQPCVGRCFAWKDGAWSKVWETEQLDLLFIPLPIVGDFDGDGHLEIAVLPWKELLVFDAATGKIKDRCAFTEGRSYGYFGVHDLDRDGRSEFVVQADFCKHVDVLGYRNGKLSLLWQRAIESGFEDPRKILRVNPNTVADVDGDGKLEVLVNLYNGADDHRWHVSVYDGITGALKADLADRYLNGLVDIDGDGKTEILTSNTSGSRVPEFGPISVYALQNGKVTVLWQCADAGWQSWDSPFQFNVNSLATNSKIDVLHRNVNGRAMLVLRGRENGGSGDVKLSLVSWDGKLTKRASIAGKELSAIALDSNGCMLCLASTVPDAPEDIAVESAKAEALCSYLRAPSICSLSVAKPTKATTPTILAHGVGEEIVTFQVSDVGKPVSERRIAGRGQGIGWDFQVYGPVAADLLGNGRRQIIYACAAPSGCGRLVARDFDGKELWRHDFPNILGGAPVWNTGGVILWQVGHFTSRDHLDVLVQVRRSIMHSEETYLLSGLDGRDIWHRDHQITRRGVGGTEFAIADFDGDGLDDAASMHPSLLYILKGTTGKDILAMEAHWDQIQFGAIYWGMPVAGQFKNNGTNVLFMASGASITGVVRPNGKLVWYDALEKSPSGYPAFGDFDGDGRMEVIGIGYPEDGIRCYDTATGRIKWRLPMPDTGVVVGTASGDINSDGRDEAIFCVNSKVYCVAADKSGEAGSIVWTIDLQVTAGPPTIADVYGKENASILVTGSDGNVYSIE